MDEYNPITEYEPIDEPVNNHPVEPIQPTETTEQTEPTAVSNMADDAQPAYDDAQPVTDVEQGAEGTTAPRPTCPATDDKAANQEVIPQQPAPLTPPVYPQYQNPVYTPPQPGAVIPPYQPQGYNSPVQNGYPSYNAPNVGYPQPSMPQPPQPTPYGNNQNPNQPVYNPYMQQPQYNAPQSPYAPPAPNPAQKQKTPVKTIVFISIMCVLLVGFIAGFAINVASVMEKNKTHHNNTFPTSSYATEFAFDYDDDDNLYLAPDDQDNLSFDVEITLLEDKGETQQNSENKSENSAAPDKNAKKIELKKLPKDKDDKKYTAQTAYDAVTDSVVSILLYEEEITDNKDDIVAQGTGTIITSDGYIVTNSHVIGDSKAYAINVVLNSKKEYRAKVVGYDTRTDLALIKIDAKNLSPVTFCDSSLVKVGDDIIVIGNPGGSSFQNSLTKGIVSAVDRELPIVKSVDFIQTDAAINPGNSGGPMCNIYGQVIGINSAKITVAGYEGMGFSIESNDVVEIINDLMHYGYVKDRVRIGFSGQEVSSSSTFFGNTPSGIMVLEIDDNGPLADTDIEQYDIITQINGESVSTFQDIFAILSDFEPGDKITLTVYRGD